MCSWQAVCIWKIWIDEIFVKLKWDCDPNMVTLVNYVTIASTSVHCTNIWSTSAKHHWTRPLLSGDTFMLGILQEQLYFKRIYGRKLFCPTSGSEPGGASYGWQYQAQCYLWGILHFAVTFVSATSVGVTVPPIITCEFFLYPLRIHFPTTLYSFRCTLWILLWTQMRIWAIQMVRAAEDRRNWL